MSPTEVSLSIGDLVGLVHRIGDLTYESSHYGRNRALEGIRAHQKLQKQRAKEDESYQAEVSLSHMEKRKGLSLLLRGRMDGLWPDLDRLEEIKSLSGSYDDVQDETRQFHLAQLKMYGFIYGLQNGRERINLRLSYVQLENDQVFEEDFLFCFLELESFFKKTMDEYFWWAEFGQRQIQKRDKSAQEIQFPFGEFRKGQWKMSALAYNTIKTGGTALIQAPTGIGKTMGTLFPGVKAMGLGHAKKIFYLTARTMGQKVARDSIDVLRREGLSFHDVTITAKAKACLEPEAGCDAEKCVYAKGYFKKVKPALEYALTKYQSLEKENIELVAKRFEVCPFELSLDLLLWADGIICDYNYAFDPKASLRRFFAEGNDQSVSLLIDESHNLVDRSREMFSCRLEKKDFLVLKRNLKKSYIKVDRALAKVSRSMNVWDEEVKETPQGKLLIKKLPENLINRLRNLRFKMEEVLGQGEDFEGKDEFLDVFFEVSHFLKMSELFDEHFVCIISVFKRFKSVEIFCLNPGPQIQKTIDQVQSSVFFSATLTPKNYYGLFFENEESLALSLESPFPQSHQKTLVASHIFTTYKMRGESMIELRELIGQGCRTKKGHYLAFFPSYEYLDQFVKGFEWPDVRVIAQSRDMTPTQRDEFLGHFVEHDGTSKSLLGLAVMGGGFSEGIDLVGKRLIGVFVVGVGLPSMSFRRDLIKNHFKEKLGQGFSYAYQFPGVTRVLQSAGRVIRTMNDRGIVVLIDQRFKRRDYKATFPSWWQPEMLVSNRECIKAMEEFWDQNETLPTKGL